jgi:hypothetical protein
MAKASRNEIIAALTVSLENERRLIAGWQDSMLGDGQVGGHRQRRVSDCGPHASSRVARHALVCSICRSGHVRVGRWL